MTVMKFVQLFILKKKLKESMSPGDYYVNQADLPSCDLLDLTCINCKGKYTKLMEKLKIIQTFRPPPNVSIAINKSGFNLLNKHIYNAYDNKRYFILTNDFFRTENKLVSKSNRSFL